MTPEHRPQNGQMDSDKAALLIFAVRYALGRRTYAPSIVTKELLLQKAALSDNDLDCVIRDIRKQGEFGYGDAGDQHMWLKTLEWMEKERASR